jgi:hypothetical protein
VQKDKNNALSLCRTHKEDAAGLAFRSLLGLRFEELKEKLLAARGDEALEIRGAALELRELLQLVEREPQETDVRDGAYS